MHYIVNYIIITSTEHFVVFPRKLVHVVSYLLHVLISGEKNNKCTQKLLKLESRK